MCQGSIQSERQLLATSTVRMKTILSNHTACGHPRKCGHHSEGMHWHCEGPQRHPVEGVNFNVVLGLLGKAKTRLWVDTCWGNRKEQATVHTVQSWTECDEGCYMGFPLQDEACVYSQEGPYLAPLELGLNCCWWKKKSRSASTWPHSLVFWLVDSSFRALSTRLNFHSPENLFFFSLSVGTEIRTAWKNSWAMHQALVA